LRFNNATLASVTHIYVSDANCNSNDVSGFLGAIKANDWVRVFDEDNSNVFLIGEVTAVSDQGSYFDYTITYLESNGTFTNGQNCVLTVSPAGVCPQCPQGTTTSPLGFLGMAGLAPVTSVSLHNFHPAIGRTARIEDVMRVTLNRPEQVFALPAQFYENCDPTTLMPVGITGELPVRLGARVHKKHVTITIDPADLAACHGSLQVFIKISGVRKGFPTDPYTHHTEEDTDGDLPLWTF